MHKNKTIIILLLAFTLTLLAGCIVQSLNPFYTKDTLLELKELNGKWVPLKLIGEDVSHENIKPWIFNDDKIYTSDQEGNSSVLSVRYFKVGDTFFMDTTITDDDIGGKLSGYSGLHIVPVHCVCKLELNEDSLTLISLDAAWLEDLIDKSKIQISFMRISGSSDYRICNAKPEEWIDFFKKYRNDEEAFESSSLFVFERFKDDDNQELKKE